MKADRKVKNFRLMTDYFTTISWAFRKQHAKVEYQKITVDGHELDIGIFKSTKGNQNDGAIVYFHGGGFVVGSIKSHYHTCCQLAENTGRTIISIAYRLAPEHPFPSCALDGIAATKWVIDHAASLGINPGKVVVAGDSAGGNVAAVTAIQLKEQGYKLQGQMLFYPVIDYYDPPTASYLENAKDKMLPRDSMIWFWDLYLKNNTVMDAGQTRHPLCTPMVVGEAVRGVAPALMLLAEKDVLRDEGKAYAEFLQNNDVPVEVTVYADNIHGYVGGWPGKDHFRAMAQITKWINQLPVVS